MFTPFNAAKAEVLSSQSVANRKEETKYLAQAYLLAAHVYILRAASRGFRAAGVYCPSEASEIFVETLTASGFEVSKHPQLCNRYVINW